MPRRLKSAVELVSDIGEKAFDLQHHEPRDIVAAVAILREVNGPMFDWLINVLRPVGSVAKDSGGSLLGG